MRIPISKPLFGEEEMRAILAPLQSGWVVQGPRVAEFEQAVCEFTGALNAVATTSCTSALHLALILSGVGPGDEVLVPAFTWVATANAIEMQGARPVFVDIDLETFNLDVGQVEAAITGRTRAILPVSLFGLSAELGPLRRLAQERGLKLIEDAACALGSYYHGKHSGTQVDFGCFSFHPRKAITTGEGGMLVTGNSLWAEAARSLRDHGASVSDLARHLGPRPYLLPDFNQVGFNYRMTDLQGALGVAQMARLEGVLEARRQRAARYDQALQGLHWLRTPAVPPGHRHGYQAYVCLYAPDADLARVEELHAQRNRLMGRLEEAGVSTRPGTHAVHCLGFFRDRYALRPGDYPRAYLADRLSLALPLYPQMTDQEQDYVVEQLRK